MQHIALPSDVKPGEELYAYRIRQALPAAQRDRLLPPADAELVRRVRREQNARVLNEQAAYQFIRKLFLANADTISLQECKLLGQRLRALFPTEFL